MTPDQSPGRPAGDLISPAENTWCPGCGNFSIQHMMKSAVAELSEEEGIPLRNFVFLGGIGCHGKLADYLNVNSLYAIHGRSVPAATGIRLANPDLKVICHVGDGDIYAEGLDHLIFAAKRNSDITVIVHDNRVYGLTTGQYTPTSPTGFRGRSTPGGITEHPLNPLEVMLAAGATHIARGYTKKIRHLKDLFKEAIMHRGFSFVDVLQICATYFNLTDYYNEHAYEMKEGETDTGRYESALGKIREWDYDREAPIPLGTFYSVEKPIYEEKFRALTAGRPERRALVRKVIEEWR
ncbi:2-oxoglutarate synthase [Methanoculleus sediminis]|uniref:2-oxoglutarate synthase n=1 Tax=Methanoculleus sediminis TaxID=1550566 RepID=A0A0H1QZH5_9EURY|nr:thiamine pyrophosphate-dependent enzyme [Methanoculleus sediminis]KLK88303.1 2-oxoglutarate synthase [Methanoculleus sediminis]